MKQKVVEFLHLWMERQDLLDGRQVDDTAIRRLATLLFSEAEDHGITDIEIVQNWDELHRSLTEIIRRRHQAPMLKQ